MKTCLHGLHIIPLWQPVNFPAPPVERGHAQLSLDVNLRLFFAMAIIICGYGYVIIGVFIRDTLAYILMLFGLAGLSALFSFMAFKDNNMWVDSPDLTLSVITGSFAATVIFYMFYFLSYSFCRMGTDE